MNLMKKRQVFKKEGPLLHIMTKEIENFSQLNIDKQICENLKENNITVPTEVQVKSIQAVIDGKDIICESATGSGKTIAFGAGLIQHIIDHPLDKALIITPTRELAEQIYGVLKYLGRKLKIRACSVYGGVGYEQQIKNMRDCAIIVATPGRLLDHLQQGNVVLTPVTAIVLDEADRMFDMGFLDDVRKIMSQAKNQKQTLCYSATYPLEITALIKKFIKNPVNIKGERQVDPKKLKQVYYNIKNNDKFALLTHLIKEHKGTNMVFCNSKRMVDSVANNLRRQNVKAEAIHGGLTQFKRKQVLEDFHAQKIKTLVCTDIAARGLDIPHVTHVYNFDLPMETKSYVHRIGRTARAGKEGLAINILSSRDHEAFSNILRYEEVNVEVQDLPQFAKVAMEQGSQRRRNDGGRFTKSYGRNNSGPRSGDRNSGGRGQSSGPRRD